MVVAALLIALEQPLVFQSDPAPVAEIVRRLAEQENLAITADPNFEREWMVVRSKDLDRNLFLTDLARAAQAEWVRDGNRLILRRTREARLREAKRLLEEKSPPFEETFPALTREEVVSALYGYRPRELGQYVPPTHRSLRRHYDNKKYRLAGFEQAFLEGWQAYSDDGRGLTKPYPAPLRELRDFIKQQEAFTEEVRLSLDPVPGVNVYLTNLGATSRLIIGSNYVMWYEGSSGGGGGRQGFGRLFLDRLALPAEIPVDFVSWAKERLRSGDPFPHLGNLETWADDLNVRNYVVFLSPNDLSIFLPENASTMTRTQVLNRLYGLKSFDEGTSTFVSLSHGSSHDFAVPDVEDILEATTSLESPERRVRFARFLVKSQISTKRPWSRLFSDRTFEPEPDWQDVLAAYAMRNAERSGDVSRTIPWSSLPEYAQRFVLSRVAGVNRNFFGINKEPTEDELPNCQISVIRRSARTFIQNAENHNRFHAVAPFRGHDANYRLVDVTIQTIVVRLPSGEVWLSGASDGIEFVSEDVLTSEEAADLYENSMKSRMESILPERKTFLGQDPEQ